MDYLGISTLLSESSLKMAVSGTISMMTCKVDPKESCDVPEVLDNLP